MKTIKSIPLTTLTNLADAYNLLTVNIYTPESTYSMHPEDIDWFFIAAELEEQHLQLVAFTMREKYMDIYYR